MCYNDKETKMDNCALTGIETDLDGYAPFTQIKNYDLSKRSTIGVGGVAKVAFCPHTVEECIALLQKLQTDGKEYCVAGNLSNTLPSDEDKEIFLLTENLRGVERTKTGAFAWAGTTSGAFLRHCKKHQKTGAEFLYGIPCTLGGAAYMNAGADGKYLSEIVESVLVFRDGKKKTISLSDCNYAYKKSVFMENKDVILGVSLRLQKASLEEIEEKETYYKNRRAHLPKGRSMGCIFKNPPDRFAGALIETCGLKGKRIGGAVVSKEHANFIINDSGASSRDIARLIEEIKSAVFARYHITLEEEIRRI